MHWLTFAQFVTHTSKGLTQIVKKLSRYLRITHTLAPLLLRAENNYTYKLALFLQLFVAQIVIMLRHNSRLSASIQKK